MTDVLPFAEGVWFLNTHAQIQLAARDGADGMSVILLSSLKDDAPPLHVHHSEDEVFHVIEGTVRFLVGDAPQTAHAGQTVLGPKGLPHGFRVESDTAKMLVITRGQGFERLVRAASRPAGHAGPPEVVEPTPEQQAGLAAICASLDITLLGPPID